MKILKIVTAVLLSANIASADPAPDINIVDLDGKWHNLNTYARQGKYVAIDFVTLD